MLVIIIVFAVSLIALVLMSKHIMSYISKQGVKTSTQTEKSGSREKKYGHMKLEHYSRVFMNIGLAFSLTFVLWAFEFKDYDDSGLVDLGQLDDDFEDIMEIPPTEQPPPPPPVIQLPQIIEIPDEEEIEEEIDVDLDVEITEETVIEDIVFEEAPEEEVADEIFEIVEVSPTPPGGMRGFYKFIGKSINYPNQARRMGIEGKVYVRFVVDKDGTLTNIEAVKGIGGGCKEEAVRVLKSAPKWQPGKQRGRPVKVRMILPITFKLN